MFSSVVAVTMGMQKAIPESRCIKVSCPDFAFFETAPAFSILTCSQNECDYSITMSGCFDILSRIAPSKRLFRPALFPVFTGKW
jgi:hypothetical protein